MPKSVFHFAMILRVLACTPHHNDTERVRHGLCTGSFANEDFDTNTSLGSFAKAKPALSIHSSSVPLVSKVILRSACYQKCCSHHANEAWIELQEPHG